MAQFVTKKESKDPDFSRLSKPELVEYCKKTRRRLHELESLVEVIAKGKYTWEATFDAIAEPVMIVDQNYKVERANLAMAKVAGVPITRVVGQTCHQIFAGRSEPCVGCPIRCRGCHSPSVTLRAASQFLRLLDRPPYEPRF